ncbi:hypothetical protein QQF64_029873 [Cirrhinus molitorella]|uniref:Uncharacterized protein n=1 Tax=Cirrhinus molitorella TaxID=172907 RepID=A0ABR3N1Q3_9TELE
MMAKRQLLPSSPEKKRQKEPVNETLCAMVADELKLQFGIVREIFKEEFHPIAERIGSLEKEMRLISNNFDNVQTAVRKVKQDSAEVKLIVDTLQDKMAKLEINRQVTLSGALRGKKARCSGVYENSLPWGTPSLKKRFFE